MSVIPVAIDRRRKRRARFASDKRVPGFRLECFCLAGRKEAIGRLGVKPKLEFLIGLRDQGSLSSRVKRAFPAVRPWAFLNFSLNFSLEFLAELFIAGGKLLQKFVSS